MTEVLIDRVPANCRIFFGFCGSTCGPIRIMYAENMVMQVSGPAINLPSSNKIHWSDLDPTGEIEVQRD